MTDHWAQAVEALAGVHCHLCRDGVPLDPSGDWHDDGVDDPWPCRGKRPLSAKLLSAAAPHLERHYREKLAEELLANNPYAVKGLEQANAAWRTAADHLLRPEVME